MKFVNELDKMVNDLDYKKYMNTYLYTNVSYFVVSDQNKYMITPKLKDSATDYTDYRGFRAILF